MLRELRIKDFAIIRELEVSFREGLTALTGETGAGKSIIVDALGVVLGGRASQEMIAAGSPKATIEALFDPPSLDPDAPGSGDDRYSEDGIVMRRIIAAKNKNLNAGGNRAYLNGSLTVAQALSEAGAALVDIHGQHEHQSLLSPQNQLKILDESAGLLEERKLAGALYARAAEAREKLARLKSEHGQAAAGRELLSFQCGEIESAGLSEGEDARLDEERAVLLNQARLRELMENAYRLLYESEGAALEYLGKASSALREAKETDPRADEPLQFIGSAMPFLEEAALFLRSNRDRYEPDPERLVWVEERIELLKTIKKKYGGEISAALSYLEMGRAELERMTLDGENEAALEKELLSLDAELAQAAVRLSDRRKKFAIEAEKAVGDALKGLALEKSEFRIDISGAKIGPDGCDRVEFLFNANPGGELKPLNRVASGGELSRLMLAIKSALPGRGVPVLVFDEVDAGIGGKTAWNVAAKLKELSRSHQVLCVTHQPQVAGVADVHFSVEKKLTGGGANVIIRELSGEARTEEIARMLSGKLTDLSLKHARELIERGF